MEAVWQTSPIYLKSGGEDAPWLSLGLSQVLPAILLPFSHFTLQESN